ncbi:MAG: hypothetical protein ABI369_07510 [Acetobacteraceae bacterium]
MTDTSFRRPGNPRLGVAPLLAAALLLMAGCSRQSGDRADLAQQVPDARVEMSQVQAAFIGSGGGGTGTLFYNGNSYPFTVGGLGIGGIGISKIEARGDVYHLPDVAAFPGAYAQGRYGFAFGNASRGDLWLQNSNGVMMHLVAKRQGLMLSLGGDAVVITMRR